MLSVRDVKAGYGSMSVLFGVSLDIAEGKHFRSSDPTVRANPHCFPSLPGCCLLPPGKLNSTAPA